MAPREIEFQTSRIVKCLFGEDEEDATGMIQCDGVEEVDSFDPVVIAAKLRELGDQYDEEVVQPLIKRLQLTPVNQVASVFDEGVQNLCESWSDQDLATEKQLLKAAVMLGMAVKKNLPGLIGIVQDVVINFLNMRVAPWVQQQGGWDRISSN